MISFLTGNSSNYDLCVNNGEIIEQYLLIEYRKVFENATVKSLQHNGNTYKCLYYKGDRINLYNYFDEDEIPVDILICENVMGDSSVSLYSNNIDVSKIAIQHGGGGHKSASGIPKDNVSTFVNVYLRPWKDQIDEVRGVGFIGEPQASL
jgi:oligoribonuclease NrnB/cAMP/cGMP phosphodiesterase (DHH superfamily)